MPVLAFQQEGHVSRRLRKDTSLVGPCLLTVENVNKNFPESDETVKGHMNYQRQGVRSTKPKDFQEPNATSDYVMVMVTIDANAILLCPIKNRTDQELTAAYRTLLGRAKTTGLEVKKTRFG